MENNGIKKIIIGSCVIVAVILCFEAYRENLNMKWQGYQRQYKEEIKKLASNDKEMKLANDYSIKMRQIVLPELDRTDRCVVCHVAMEDDRMAAMPQPLKSHPRDIFEQHELEKIGCTICHDGQGRAITKNDAHGKSEFWHKPLLYAPFIESSCIRCHDTATLPDEFSIVKKGEKLFFDKGCLGCHQLKGKGGQLGPDLTDIAEANVHLKKPVDAHLKGDFHENKNIAFIYEAIKTPAAQPHVTAMPDYHFSEEEVVSLTVFLKGLSERVVPSYYLAKFQEKRMPETAHGKKLYQKYCVACHGVDAKGGVKNINYIKKTVPALDVLAERMFLDEPEDVKKVAALLEKGIDINKMTPKLDVPRRGRVLAQYRAIRNVIKRGNVAGKADPDGPAPLLHMPSWAEGLTDKDINSILAYLLRLYSWE